MKASISIKDYNRMIKAAAAFADKDGIVNGKIALLVHDGLFEVMALSVDRTVAELHQFVTVNPVYDDDFFCIGPVEDGVYTVKAKDLPKFKDTDKDILVSFEAANGTPLTIKAGSYTTGFYTFRINADQMAYDGYVFAKPEGDTETEIELTPKDCKGLKFVALAMMPPQGARDEFAGAVIREGSMVATDGHRLHICPTTHPCATLIGIIPAKVVSVLAGGICGTLKEFCNQSKPDKKGNVETFAKWHVLEAPGVRLVYRPIAGQFSDFQRVIPSYKSDEIADIDAEVLAKTVKTLSSGLKLSNCIFERTADKNLHITCRAMRLNRKSNEKVIDESIPPRATTIPAENFQSTICFNSKYILEALSGKSGTIQLCVIDQDSPAWFGSWKGGVEGMGAIVMPMMI